MDKLVPSFINKKRLIPIIPTRNGFTLKNLKEIPIRFLPLLGAFTKGLWAQLGERKRNKIK
jgi:hypothetical protein